MKTSLSVFLLFCLLLFSCDTNPSESAASASGSLANVTGNSVRSSPSTGFERSLLLKGKLGEDLLEMRLNINGSLVTGQYQVGEDQKSGRISGETDYVNYQRLAMKEFSEGGTHTGTFTGEWNEAQQLSGEWVSADGSRHTPFLVQPETASLYYVEEGGKTREIRVAYRSTAMDAPDKSCRITYVFPSFEGFASAQLERNINEQFKPAPVAARAAELEACMAHGKKDGQGSSITYSFSVNSLSAELLSVSLHRDEFSIETEKSLRHSQTKNIDPRTGIPYSLNQLFAGDYQAFFKTSVTEYLRTYAGHELGLTFEGLDEKSNINIYSDQIVFHFNPGENGPFSAGEMRISFTAEQIQPVLNAAGPLRFMVGRAD